MQPSHQQPPPRLNQSSSNASTPNTPSFPLPSLTSASVIDPALASMGSPGGQRGPAGYPGAGGIPHQTSVPYPGPPYYPSSPYTLSPGSSSQTLSANSTLLMGGARFPMGPPQAPILHYPHPHAPLPHGHPPSHLSHQAYSSPDAGSPYLVGATSLPEAADARKRKRAPGALDADVDTDADAAAGGAKRVANQDAVASPERGQDGSEEEVTEEEASEADEGSERQQQYGKKDKGAGAGSGGSGGAGKDRDGKRQVGPDGKKIKPARGSRACTNCRRLKMRCVGAENGPPCKRCKNGGHECIFEESNRGRKSVKKTEAMAKSLKKMEKTLDTVLRSIKNPGLAAQAGGMVTRSPSPVMDQQHDHSPASGSQHSHRSHLTPSFSAPGSHPQGGFPVFSMASPGGTSLSPSAFTFNPNQPSPPAGPGAGAGPYLSAQPFGGSFASSSASSPLHSQRLAQPQSHQGSHQRRRASPRLHALPDNTLNPLGLLAEASLHNSHRKQRRYTAGGGGGGGGASGSINNSLLRPVGRAASVTNAEDAMAMGGDDQQGEDIDGGGGGKGKGKGKGRASLPPGLESEGGDKGGGAGVAGEGKDGMPKKKLGVANETYFKPGPMTILPLRRIIIEREMPPDLLTQGIVSSEEVISLFKIFFENCSLFLLLLDPEWHTPTFICSRSPFLFTCVCTVASKFYTQRPELHPKCLALAKKVAFDVMSRGYKSVEIVQGFLLLSLWSQPAERFEEDKTWLFSGVAIRMATDLNLHRKSVATLPGNPHRDDPAVLDREREILNRERTWYTCFNVDRSLSAQMGKPYTIREDWIIRNSRYWYQQRLSRPWDIGVAALVEAQRIHSRQLDFLYSSTTSVSGLNTDIDYPLVLGVFNEQLEEWRQTWTERGLFNSRLASELSPDGDQDTRVLYYVLRQAPFRFHYSVLVINSFGLQRALDHGDDTASLDRAQYFAKCYQAAMAVVTIARDDLPDILRYATDSMFVTISYASVFLLKLIRPQFKNYVNEEAIISLVSDVADLLERCAVNEQHTASLYSAFLRALVHAKTSDSATTGTKSGEVTPNRNARPSVSSAVDPTQPFDVDMDLALDHVAAERRAEAGPGGAGEDEGEGEVEANANANGATEGGGQGSRPATSSGPTPSMNIPATTDPSAAPFGSAAPGDASVDAAASIPPDTTGTAGDLNFLNMCTSPSAYAAGGQNVEALLNSSWWSSLLPVGLGGPFDGLNGSVVMQPAGNYEGGGGQLTPGGSRQQSPTMMQHTLSGLEFNFPSGSLS